MEKKKETEICFTSQDQCSQFKNSLCVVPSGAMQVMMGESHCQAFVTFTNHFAKGMSPWLSGQSAWSIGVLGQDRQLQQKDGVF